MLRKKIVRTNPMSEINIVPYVDVMLVLLVIFMITAPILSQGVVVELPKAASQTVKTASREPIIVSVNSAGELYLNVSTTPEIPMDNQSLLTRVAAEIELARQAKETVNVLVKGDAGVPYGKVVQAMSLLKEAGAEQVGLLTDSSDLKEGVNG